MATITKGGFTIDIGASLLPSSHRATCQLIKDAGLQGDVQRKLLVAGVVRDGQIHRLGPSPLEPLRTELFSCSAKAGLVKGVLTARKRSRGTDWHTLAGLERFDGETVADYCRRELSQELLGVLRRARARQHLSSAPRNSSAVDPGRSNSFSPLSFNSARGGDFLVNGLARLVPVQCSARARSVLETGAGRRILVHRRRKRVRGSRPQPPASSRSQPARWRSCTRSSTVTGGPYSPVSSTRASVSPVHLGLHRPSGRNRPSGVFRYHVARIPICASQCSTTSRREAVPRRGKAFWPPTGAAHGGSSSGTATTPSCSRPHSRPSRRSSPTSKSSVEIAHVQRWRRGMMSRPGTYRDMARFGRLSPADSPIQLGGDYFGVGSSVESSLTSGEGAEQPG